MVKRRLVFHGWRDTHERQPFDRLAAAAALQALASAEVVLEHDGQTTAVQVDDPGSPDSPTRLQLLALRQYDNRPIEWEPGGAATPITMLESRYPADLTHVLIWPDNVVAHDSFANAPGLGRLASYLFHQAGQRVAFSALYDPRVLEQLRDLEGLRGYSYGISSHEKLGAASAAGLLESLAPRRWRPSSPSFSVQLGVGPNAKRDQVLEDDVEQELWQLTDRAEELFDSLKVRGLSRSQRTPTGKPKSVELNLLKQRLQVEVDVEQDPAGGNIAARPAVYEAMRGARRQLADPLTLAVDAAMLRASERRR